MHKNILVIGGTRHVGKLLVQKLVNAGHQPGPMPAHIVIDLDEATAEWVAQPDRQLVEMEFGLVQ